MCCVSVVLLYNIHWNYQKQNAFLNILSNNIVNTSLNYGADLSALQMNFIELRCITWITAKLRLHYLHCGWIATALQCEFLHCRQRNLKNPHFDRRQTTDLIKKALQTNSEVLTIPQSWEIPELIHAKRLWSFVLSLFTVFFFWLKNFKLYTAF
jgi:hypothetical protein